MSTIKVGPATRVFKIGAARLPDPEPSLAPEESVRLYARNYPIVEQCTVTGPVVEGDTLVYTVEPPPAKTKG